MTTAPPETRIDPRPAAALPSLRLDAQDGDCEHVGAAIYRTLTGRDPADAAIDDDSGFDKHVLASILAVAAMEGDAVARQAGLEARDLAALIAQWFPTARDAAATWCGDAGRAACEQAGRVEDEEIAMVRDLLLAHRSSDGDTGRWLAAMVARRSMEPNHLWEDLGLRDRTELTRLLARHFAPIAARNTKNMRWKRFFYRTLCEDDGLVMCSAPVCSRCGDFNLCFGDESGMSRLAYRRRVLALKVSSFSDADAASSPSTP